MTQEELQAMPRKEWRAYCKRMKELDKKSKEFPERTTIEELKELTDWHREQRENVYGADSGRGLYQVDGVQGVRHARNGLETDAALYRRA